MKPLFKSLFGGSVAMMLLLSGMNVFAQSSYKDGKVKLKITKTEDGKTIKVDTVFNVKDDEAIKSILEELGIESDLGNVGDEDIIEIQINKLKKGEEPGNLQYQFHTLPDWDKSAEKEARSGAFMGIYFREMSLYGANATQKTEEGIYVEDVISNTGAENAGLKSGDVILEIDGQTMNTEKELRAYLANKKPGDQIKVSYLRDSKKSKTTLTLGEKNPELNWNEMDFRFPFMKEELSWTCDPNESKKAFLGVMMDLEESSSQSAGMKISGTVENSTAEEMGLLKGDIIRQMNGRDIPNFEALKETISTLKPGDEVSVKFEREGQEMTASGLLKKKGENMIMKKYQSIDDNLERSLENLQRKLDKQLEIHGSEIETNIREAMEKLQQELQNLEGVELDKDFDFDFEIFNLEDEETGNARVKNITIIIQVEDMSEQEMNEFNEEAETNLSTDNSLNINKLKFSPNPNDGRFRLSFNLADQGNTEINVMDMSGGLVYKELLPEFSGEFNSSIDISEKGSGAYILQISQNGKSITKKIIIQ